jgi:hypothetical protein
MDKPCTDAQVVALTERIAAMDRLIAERFDALDKLYIAQQAALKLALDHQAEIYESRLKELNNAHERADQLSKTVLTKDQYETKHENVVQRISDLERIYIQRISEIEKWRANIEGRLYATGIIFGLLVTVINISIGVILHFLK